MEKAHQAVSQKHWSITLTDKGRVYREAAAIISLSRFIFLQLLNPADKTFDMFEIILW